MARGWHLSLGQKKARLISKINLVNDETSCWNWNGHARRNRGGYGSYKWSDRKNWLAHRLVWHLFVGDMSDPEVKLLHKCDNVLCVRPTHLFTGTQADNNEDMKQKGRARGPKGSLSGMAKLTEDCIPVVKKLYKDGLTQIEIGKKFNVSHSTIGRILKGKTWNNVR